LSNRAISLIATACALPGFAFAVAASAEDSAAPVSASRTAQQAPSDGINRLHEALYDVMREAETLGYTGRFERLKPVVDEVFDLDFMAEKSVGRHWKTASPEERTRLLEAFHRYTVANYAGRFTGWSGQEFTTHGEEASARGTMLVRTTLHDPSDEDVQLDYRLRKTDNGWRIVDIYFNGTVSELALRRSEYSSLIKREGFEALLTALHERIEELESLPGEKAS